MPTNRRPPPERTKSIQRRTITNEEEACIQQAKHDYESRRYSSISAAAKAHGVPYFTLRRRIQGLTQHCKRAHDEVKLLSDAEEKTLVDWVQYLGLTGHPLNKRTIRPKIQAILVAKGARYLDDKCPSKAWIRRFMKRNKELRAGRGSGLDPKRAKAFNYTTVHGHFLLVQETIEKHNIPWRNVYNMDEKGIQMGGGRKGTRVKYFFSNDDKMKYKLQSDELQLVTIIEVISADGTADIGPGFVFPGASVHWEWFKELDFQYTIGTSPNGWTDDEIGFEWFKQAFVPQATERNQRATEWERAEQATAAEHEGGDGQSSTSGEENSNLPPILLIYDGHGSHLTLPWIDLAIANNIILYCLPPHTTHRLQPLDVGCFGPLQVAWFQRCDKILDETGEGMEMKDVVHEYLEARKQAFTEKNINQAWRKSGLRPLNPDIFTASDFAPSHRSSTAIHAPSSFPSMPCVPDLGSDDSEFDPAHFQHLTGEPIDLEEQGHSDCESDSSNDWNQGMDFSSEVSEEGSDDEMIEDPAVDSLEEPTHPHEASEHSFNDIHENNPRQTTPRPNIRLLSDNLVCNESIEFQDTPLARYPGLSRPVPTPAAPSLAPTSTPTNPAFTSPLHYTRSQRRSQMSQSMPRLAESLVPLSLPVHRNDELQLENRQLKMELAHLRAQRDAAEMHAVFSQRDAAIWKYRCNKKVEKAAKGSSRRVHVKARVVTNEAGRQDAIEDLEKRQAKQQKEHEKKTRKADKQKGDIVRRATQGQTREFAGSLQSKNKTELEDIADALGLDIEGTKQVLTGRISEHFDKFPHFKEDCRFRGIFERTRGRKRHSPDDENQQPSENPPPAQRRRLSIPGSNLSTVTNTHSASLWGANPPMHSPPNPPPNTLPVASSSRVRLEHLPPSAHLEPPVPY